MLLHLTKKMMQEFSPLKWAEGSDSLIKVSAEVRAQALGILGVNFCPGIMFCGVNFAQALSLWQFLTKNV